MAAIDFNILKNGKDSNSVANECNFMNIKFQKVQIVIKRLITGELFYSNP